MPVMTLLPDGKVLVAGGTRWDGNQWHSLKSAELFDPAHGRFSPTGSMKVARLLYEDIYGAPTATRLNDGRVLVAGGEGDSGYIDTAELFDPRTGRWTIAKDLPAQVGGAQAELLNDGRVLIAGGYVERQQTSDAAMIYQP